MMPNHDEIDDIPSLVPERDELVLHRKQKRGTSQSSRPGSSQEAAAGGTSGVVIFFITLLTLGMCTTGGAAWYFYQQGVKTKANLESAANRLTSLEGTLNQMGETTKQSAMGLMQKVDSNFGEIDKLWAARNVVRTEVEKLGVAMTAVQKTTNELGAAVNSQANQLSQHNNQIAAAQTKIEQISKNFAGMENLGQQLTQLNADLNRVKVTMNKLDSEINKRVGNNEQDIESINVYRSQMNQTIANLQNSINILQQKVGK